MPMLSSAHVPNAVIADEPPQDRDLLQPQRGARERELLQVLQNLSILKYRIIMLYPTLLTFQFVSHVGC